jgi:hypothetical protein
MEGKKRGWRLVAASLLGLSLLTAAYRLSSLVGSQQETPPLAAAPETLRLGPVDPSPDYKHHLRIKNTSGETIKIDEFLSTCTCVSASPSSMVLEPGAEQSLDLEINLARYVTPGREPVIRGVVHIDPVVDGRRMKGWDLDLSIIRPKILTASTEFDFGAIYNEMEEVMSRGTVLISDEIAHEAIRAVAKAPFIQSVKLVRLQDAKEPYSEYGVELTLSRESRPRALQRFILEIESPGGKLTIPCTARFDSGLRWRVAEPPPTLMAIGRETRWTLTVHSVLAPIDQLDVQCSAESESARCEAVAGRTESGAWRVSCRATARAAGNVPCTLSLVAYHGNGQTSTATETFPFYVPTAKGQ